MNISVILAAFSPLQLAFRSFPMLQPWGMLVLDGDQGQEPHSPLPLFQLRASKCGSLSVSTPAERR